MFRGFILGCLIILTIACQPSTAQPNTPAETYADTLRTLIVFAQFIDDTSVGDAGVSFREWPLGKTEIPAFGHLLLSETKDPPYPDSSLTEYFYKQSNGNFLLYGTAHPFVYVSKLTEENYHRPAGGYGNLTLEIVNYLDNFGVDFTEYDANNDGILDNLVIIVRSDTKRDDKTMTHTGISCLDARCGGRISAGPKLDPVTVDGILVDWDRSGSFLFNRTPGNVLPFWYHVRLMAHELGHDVWRRFFVHIPAFKSNDVPLTSNRNPRSSCIGYVLMAGAGGAPDCGGDITISAFERDLLGWIDCEETDLSSQKKYVLGDLVSTGACVKIATSNGRQFLYISNRQRMTVFDQLRSAGVENQFDYGLLRTTGLLIMRTNNRQVDVLPADNSLDLSADDSVYNSDLWGGHIRQITPFTRPNINGYTVTRRGSTHDYFAIDDIRLEDSADRAVSFTSIPDFRRDPVFRSDSWITNFPEALTTSGTLVVTEGAVLTIERENLEHVGDIEILNGGTVLIADGASITLTDCGAIKIGHGARLDNRGRIAFSGNLLGVAGSEFRQTGSLRLTDTDCR